MSSEANSSKREGRPAGVGCSVGPVGPTSDSLGGSNSSLIGPPHRTALRTPAASAALLRSPPRPRICAQDRTRLGRGGGGGRGARERGGGRRGSRRSSTRRPSEAGER
eukprot:scaffold33273_cov31-Tisochrysis_lutea.AAC.2